SVFPVGVLDSLCDPSYFGTLDFSTSPDMMVNYLLHGIRRHDFDALDHDAFGRFARFAHAVSGHLCVTDFFQNIIAFDQLAERRVLMVEPAYRGEAEEELRAGGVGIRPARHRDHAALVTVIVELGLDIVTRSAFAVAVLFCRVFRIRTAAPNHESFDDPVQNAPGLKALARDVLDVFDRVMC